MKVHTTQTGIVTCKAMFCEHYGGRSVWETRDIYIGANRQEVADLLAQNYAVDKDKLIKAIYNYENFIWEDRLSRQAKIDEQAIDEALRRKQEALIRGGFPYPAVGDEVVLLSPDYGVPPGLRGKVVAIVDERRKPYEITVECDGERVGYIGNEYAWAKVTDALGDEYE